MAQHYQTSEPIIVGSGELFVAKFDEISNPANLTTTDEAKLVNIGAIEADAQIVIAKDRFDVRSANRKLLKVLSADTNVTFSCGIMTWVLDNLSKFLLNSSFTEDATTGEKKSVIGIDDTMPEVYLRFVHKKLDGGELVVNIYKAVFSGDLSVTFAERNATTTNYEFRALAFGDSYMEILETFPE